MIDDHERIEELLAGYALRSLDGADDAEAEEVLAEHVTACSRCRETLAAFQRIAGEIALVPPEVEPPELVRTRLSRRLGAPPDEASRRRLPWFATAAAVAVILGMGFWNMSIGQRASEADEANSVMHRALDLAGLPGASLDSLGDQLIEVTVPSHRRVFLIGRDVPPPAAGRVYVLWVSSGDRNDKLFEFLPNRVGVVALEFVVDAAEYDRLWITEQSPGAELPGGSVRWSSDL
jgi:hypothetical protein